MTRYRVVCDDWKGAPTCKTREDAERRKRSIEDLGICKLEHRIEPIEGHDD